MHEEHQGHDIHLRVYCDTCEEVLAETHGPAKVTVTPPPKPLRQRDLYRKILPDFVRTVFYCGVPFFFVGWESSGGSFHAIAWAWWLWLALLALDTFAWRSSWRSSWGSKS